MIDHTATDLANAAIWQTGIAVIQAVSSVGLLAWYVGAARAARQRAREERAGDFNSLVCLCRDLGVEAKNKTELHRQAAEACDLGAGDIQERIGAWRSDMTVIYVCLNEVPHYEVRSPTFSIALTRLWLEVDSRTVKVEDIQSSSQLEAFLAEKLGRICREVDAMAALIETASTFENDPGRLSRKVERRGKTYAPMGYP
jgi:putative hemolysin